ncbi:MAG: RecQ family ATP-dependent DNA helicase [Bacteroidetes bacterium]|nr:MAG: RecQ family ATP-dependent DNA helicase [Bacteroidota bacterium]
MTAAQNILKQYWGYNQFRPLQEEIIQSVIDGKDTLAILPTGGGKSICFQVPAMHKKGICLVVSPLIALMKDQVANLRAKGIQALAIHSGMNFSEVKKTLDNALYGNFKFLYVSPERLETDFFKEYLPALDVNLIAVDEAHCISQWGYDFRPSYLNIAKLREEKPKVPILALTASATREVQNDICEKLLFRGHSVFQKSYERPNLSYSCFKVDVKINKLLEILQKTDGCGIVYCRSRRRCQEISNLLNLHGVQADYYHAGLLHEERNQKQENWIRNQTRIIVCTNAFGMGIDKPDVRVVVHVDVPESLENYYQEAGRAGRDGKKSYAVLLYQQKDLDELKELSDLRYPGLELIRKVYQALANYLQLPVGFGKDQSFDLDLDELSERFKLDPVIVMNVLKILEQEKILSYNENLLLPSTVVFTSGNQSLREFETEYPQLDPLIKTLLRNYSGILDMPVTIRENAIARMLKKEVDKVRVELDQLNKARILQYKPQSESPQIMFLEKRIATENLVIDQVNYLKRKKAFEDRVGSMINYTEATNACRSLTIARYFNDLSSKECGICDNCLKRKKSALNKSEFYEISHRIFQSLDEGPLSVRELLSNLTSLNSEHTLNIIDHLISERKIEMDEGGRIRKSP